jgi:hypothetical protein
VDWAKLAGTVKRAARPRIIKCALMRLRFLMVEDSLFFLEFNFFACIALTASVLEASLRILRSDPPVVGGVGYDSRKYSGGGWVLLLGFSVDASHRYIPSMHLVVCTALPGIDS